MTMRLFALEELRPPAGVPGAPRVAGPADLALLARWRRDFAQAALPSVGPPGHDIEASVARQLLAGQGNILWEVDGEPVAVAAASAPAAGMSRLAAVWTPPQRRGRGFGSAVTAAASTWALDAGAVHVVLFTDLDNPVTNAIYPRLGYRPVHDAIDLAFERSVGRT
jgi:RimJ/RimL family protein N-acetyltransferase